MPISNGAGGGASSGALAGLSSGGLFGAGLGALLGGVGGFLASKDATRARRRQRAAIESARQFADQVVERVTSGELFSNARDFLTSSFRDSADSPLAQDTARQIRSAQAVRGTFHGNLAAVQEGVGTSAAAQRLRSSLLPSALQFSLAPEQLRQSVLGFEAPLRVAAATGGQLAGVGPSNLLSQFSGGFGGAVSGGLGGFQIGSAIQAQSQTQNFLRQQQQAQALQNPSGLDPFILQQLQQGGFSP